MDGSGSLRLKPIRPPNDEGPVDPEAGPSLHRPEELNDSQSPSRGER